MAPIFSKMQKVGQSWPCWKRNGHSTFCDHFFFSKIPESLPNETSTNMIKSPSIDHCIHSPVGRFGIDYGVFPKTSYYKIPMTSSMYIKGASDLLKNYGSNWSFFK